MLRRSHSHIVLSAALLALTVGCSGGQPEATTPSPTTAASPAASPSPATSPSPAASPTETPDSGDSPKNKYPAQVVKNFVDACTAGRGADVQAVCTCSINKIQDEYTLEEFAKIDTDVQKGAEPPKEMQEIVESCKK